MFTDYQFGYKMENAAHILFYIISGVIMSNMRERFDQLGNKKMYAGVKRFVA